MWNRKYKSNRQNRNRLTNTKNESMVTKREAGGEMGKKVNGIKRYKFPVIKQISHGNVRYSTGKPVNNVIPLYSDRWLLHLSW